MDFLKNGASLVHLITDSYSLLDIHEVLEAILILGSIASLMFVVHVEHSIDEALDVNAIFRDGHLLQGNDKRSPVPSVKFARLRVI